MTNKTIEKIAEELGMEVEYKKYSYWDNILHIGNTAICFNNTTDTNSYGIITEPENFPKFATKEYIKDQIENEEKNLGYHKSYISGNKPFGAKQWFTTAEYREAYGIGF